MSRVYDLLPVWVQNLGISLYGLHLQHLRYGGSSRQHLGDLVRHEAYDLDEMNRLVLDLVRQRALLALREVPAYRSLAAARPAVEAAATPEEILDRFPVLTKDVVRTNPRSYIPRHVRGRLHTASTSGTTGSPLPLFRTRDGFRRNFAFFSRVRRWRGLSHRNRTAAIMGRPAVPHGRQCPPFWRHSWWTGQIVFSSYHLRPDTLSAYAHALHAFQPEQLVCYPSSGGLVARAMLAEGLRLSRARATFTTSETLGEEQRRVMEEAFGCPVADQYGSGEWTVWISQCEEGTYHNHPDYGFLEVLSPEGGRIRQGTGRCVATGFVNDAMVLMRYDAGDRVTVDERDCRCGRRFPTVAAIQGRQDEILYTPDGRIIGHTERVFVGLSGIQECQLVQTRLDRIEARVVPDHLWGALAEQALRAALRSRLGDAVEIRIRPVPAIARTANGKFRAVVGMAVPPEKGVSPDARAGERR